MKDEEGFKSINANWRKYRALEFLAVFCGNHKDEVENNALFVICSQMIDKRELKERLLKRFEADGVLQREEDVREGEGKLRAFILEDDGDKFFIENNFSLSETHYVIGKIWDCSCARDGVRDVLCALISERLRGEQSADAEEDPLCRSLAEVQRLFDLSDFERRILLLAALKSEGLIDRIDGHRRHSSYVDKINFYAKCLDCNSCKVAECVAPESKLRLYECVDDEIELARPIASFLAGTSSAPLAERYFTSVSADALPWDFFAELVKKHGRTLTDMLNATDGHAPCNILLYGEPGTGKTSFARALAAKLGRRAYEVAFADEDSRDRDNSVRFRTAGVRVCVSQVPGEKSLIIIDEADSLLCQNRGLFGMSKSAVDKGQMNALLDLKGAPRIWISNNDRRDFDDSNIRRFDYSISFGELSDAQRARIWKNALAKAGVPDVFSAGVIRGLARKYPVSAGGISLAVKNIAEQKASGKSARSLVDRILKPHCELLGINIKTKRADDVLKPSKDYSLEGLNISGDISLERIVESVRRFQKEKGAKSADRPRMNILLSGAPGTGKTEFVKYLGSELKTKVHVAMGSELLDCYVGGTEKNIRIAFDRAAKNKEILFLDEIDGLVQSRAGAARSWEVSQVNEILHQMENFSGVMVGATNFADNLDPAIMRRFTFKLRFDYLDGVGKVKFFERFFKLALSEAERRELETIPNLAPGDFRTVRQSRHYLGGEMSAADWLSALREESAMKKQNSIASHTIGFHS